MFKKFISRKLAAVVFGAFVVPMLQKFGVTDPGMTQSLLQLLLAYIGGQSAVDTVVAYKAAPSA